MQIPSLSPSSFEGHWWRDADGYWQRFDVFVPPPPPALPGAADRSWARPQRRGRSGAWYLAGALTAGLLGLALVALVGRSAPATRAPVAAHSTAGFDFQRFAERLGLQASDLPRGYSPAPPSLAQGLAVPVPVSTCPGVGGVQWMSEVVSPTYFSSGELSGQVSAASVVAVLADPAGGQAALRATQDPSFPSRCVQAPSDAAVQKALGTINQQAPCHLDFQGSSVGPVPGAALGSNQTGYRYQATVGCQAEGSSETFVRDVISTDVGRTFTQLTLSSTGGTIAQSLESRVVAAVNHRAADAPA